VQPQLSRAQLMGESPKPAEFGSAGQNWENVGWKVTVLFIPLSNRIRPKDHMEALRPVLSDRYSPLQANGNGYQGVYLTELPPVFAEVLAGLIGSEAAPFMKSAETAADSTQDVHQQFGDDLDSWEHMIETRIELDASVKESASLNFSRLLLSAVNYHKSAVTALPGGTRLLPSTAIFCPTYPKKPPN
jgi:putative restriction endonuclease